MLSARKALVRQLQQMFHEHLVGVAHWDDAEIANPVEVQRRPGQQREAGKYHDQILLHLGPFDIEAKGPDEHPPCGLVAVKCGKHAFEGPLDAVTWRKVADFIKEHQEEENDGNQATSSIGDPGARRGDWGRR